MSNLGTNFYPKLIQISNELGMKPEDLLAVMTSESGINPGSYESKFHGSGLLGFMPDTLKGLGFKGDWKDFTNLTGENQLDYVKKLVQNNMQLNGGKSFSSAASYYTANLWPIALKLSGIQNEDPNTSFIEENPETITDSIGKRYSKKYYELGYKITPEYERSAYKYNPLFHGSKNGAITYGDMIKQVDKIKSGKIYQQALANLKSAYNEAPAKEDNVKSKSDDTSIISQISNLLSKFLALLAESNEQLIKRADLKLLPEHKFIIRIGAKNVIDAIEFSRILCAALDEELMANGTIYTNWKSTEIECKINGDKELCSKSIDQLCIALSEVFEEKTKNIGGIKINATVLPNMCSNYQELSIKLAELNYTMFHNKFKVK